MKRFANFRKQIKMIAAAVLTAWTLCSFGIIFSGGAELPGAVTETINSQEELVQWYEKQTGTGNTVGILAKGLVINKEIRLSSSASTGHGLIQIRIPEGPVRILGQGALKIDDPGVNIMGPHHLFTVEENGKLILAQAAIGVEDKTKPSILCRTREQVIISDKVEGARELIIEASDTPGPDPLPPDESQPHPLPDPPEQEMDPELTEVYLLNIASDKSGSARLSFANIPANITGLYISRSPDGKTWTKEKNKRTLPSSQNGQGTVEYENFLKEPDNTLDTSIVNDGYMIYNFQSANHSFYIKVRFEWPDGSWESRKTKVAVPEYTGQGLTFVYGGGSSGGYYGSYGSSGGSSGRSSYGNYSYNTQDSEGTQEESDASEGPISRGGGGLSWKDFFPDFSRSVPESVKGPENASPSTAKQIPDPAQGSDPTDTEEEALGNTENGPAEVPDEEPLYQAGAGELSETPDNGMHKKTWTGVAAAVIIIACAGIGLIFYRRKKK